jgi:diguanylate cyclase
MPIFLMGLGVGTTLLLLGLGVGFLFGRRQEPPAKPEETLDSQQFLLFLQKLSRLTDEVAGDVSKYQTQLSSINRTIGADPNHRQPEVQGLISQITQANLELQQRLDMAEERLALQTKEMASYLSEARTDGLTGLANRRAFDKTVDERFKLFQQAKTPFTLALIDIDHFKQVNDKHGHPAGDAVLKEIGRRFQEQMTGAIQVARYGGEEFAILLEGPLEAQAHLIDQLRVSIASVPVDAEGKKLPITISCGVSQIAPEERIGRLVRRSDEALYAAKLGGRNRVYMHDGTLCRLVGKPTASAIADRAASEHGDSRFSTIDAPHTESGELDLLRIRLQQRLKSIVGEEAKLLNQ